VTWFVDLLRLPGI